MKDELVAFVHCSNPLAQQDEISLDLLRQTPIVLRELGSGTLDVILLPLHLETSLNELVNGC